MSKPSDKPGAARSGATVAQLKNDIDSGRTGDKTSGFDPAAAPLGTDDEAAGTPPSPEIVAQAREAERRPSSKAPNAAEPGLAPDGALHRRKDWTWPALILGAVLLLVLLSLVVAPSWY